MDTPHDGPASTPATTEELLAHAGWVRALSRALVTDPNAAEDIEQDAWVAALQRPPTAGDGLRAWWARVVRNEASDMRRGQTRRTDREQRSHEAAHAPSAFETNAALEAQKRLVAAIDALEEPLRATVVRRYLQGLTSRQIAEMDGVPESTVRTRLQRALERLRRELDERTQGGRAAWSALLMPLARRDEVLASTTASAGIGVGVLFAMGIALVLAVLAGTFATQYLSAPETAESDAVASAAVELPPTPRAVDASDPSAPSDSDARAAASEVAASSASETAASAASADVFATLSARFVTAAGRPIPGATLTSLDRSGTGECKPEEAPTAVSDGNGRVELVLRDSDRSHKRGQRVELTPGSWDPVIEAGGRGWARIALHPTATLGTHVSMGYVVLHEGADAHGRCLAADGAPLAGLWVELIRPDLTLAERDAVRSGAYWTSDQVARARTAADGSFALRGVPVGTFRIHVDAHGWQPAISDAFDLRTADDLTLPDLVLRRNERTIRGVVLFPDGTPCGSADIEWTFDEEGIWVGGNTQDDGSFLIAPRSDRPVDLCATSNRKVLGDGLALAVAPGTDGVVLQLTEPRWIDVLVTDEQGEPIEHYELASLLAGQESGSSERTARPGGRSKALARARPTIVRVAATGRVTQERGPFTLVDAPESLTIVLTRAALVSGTVRRDGEPVAGIDLRLSPVLEAPRTRRDGFPQRVGEDLASAITDAKGEFTIGAQRAGRYVIWGRLPDQTLLESAELELDPSRPVEGVVIESQRSGTLEGHVTTRPGAESAAAQVVLSNGLPDVRPVVVGSDGTFAAEGLPPGTWWLRCAAEPGHWNEFLPTGERLEDPTLRTIEIATQRTTRIEVDLRGVEERAVEGRLRLGGRAPERWTARLHVDGPYDTRRGSAPVQADASFRLPSEWTGWHTLSLRSSGSELRDDRVDVRIAIGARTVRWELATELGTLDLQGPAHAQRELRIDLAGGTVWITNFRFDAQGRALLDGLPHGTVRMRVPGEDVVRFETTIGAVTPPRFTVP